MFKRIFFTAGFAGLLAALVLSLFQILWITPLLLQAETYEVASESMVEPHEHAPGAPAHHHDAEAWAPADGWERTLSTLGGNLVVAVGFSLMLAGLFTLRQPNRAWQGVLWGIAGYLTFCLAPSLGLPPELPGTAAADLTLRQGWWIGTAAATAASLALLVFTRHWALRLVALVLLVLPHIIGAPQPAEHSSLAPESLQSHFRLAALISNAAFWIALGWLSAWFYTRDTAENN
ncbi:cobalt transporter subunit CbtA [Pseudomonas duriflava]|uniref:Cobalt transporter subunit CbtA n=1 Tax=Pseudomonas duriflava TaxID=459528 RepID=A0A562Q2T4_9PSED|nr:CbtA family protein [Pseudomonas duriflava]TWI50983.1 cobalt transporter subunit CbtA [Pseudomonas duriflava]